MHFFALLFLGLFGWCTNYCPKQHHQITARNPVQKNKYLLTGHPQCSYLNEAYNNLNRGDIQNAVINSNKAAQIHGEDFQTIFILQEAAITKAAAYLKINENDLGQAALKQAVEYNSKIKNFSLSLQFAQVNYAKNKNQFNVAINLLTLATLQCSTSLLESNGYFLTWHGWLFYQNKQLAQAKKYFEYALHYAVQDNSMILEAYHGLTTVQIALKDYKEAELLLEESKCYLPHAKNGELYRLYNDEKLLDLASNRPDKAISLIQRILRNKDLKTETKAQLKIELQELLIKKLRVDTFLAQQKAAEQIELQINGKQFKKSERLFEKNFHLDNIYGIPNKNLINAGIHLYKIQKKYEKALGLYRYYFNYLEKNSTEYNDFYFDYKSLFLRQQVESGISLNNVFDVLQEIQSTSQKDSTFLLTDFTIRILSQAYSILNIHSRENWAQIYPQKKNFFTEDIFSHFFWGQFWLTQQQYEKAKNEFSILTKLYKDSPVGYAGMQNTFVQENNFQASIEQYILAKNILGTRWFGYVQIPLVTTFNYVGKNVPIGDLEPLTKKLAQSLPNYKNVIYAMLSRIYFDRNQLQEAEKMSLLSISLAQPDSSHRDWPYIMLGDIYSSKGDFTQSEAYYKTALALAPKVIMTLVSAAQLYQKYNHLDQAAELYKKIVFYSQEEMDLVDEGNPQYLKTEMSKAYLELGQIAMIKNQKKEALNYFHAVLQQAIPEHTKIASSNISKLVALTKWK